MFCLAICDDDTLHMQNTLRCARETPEAADCDIRTFSAPGELMDAVTGGGYRPHIALLDICMPGSSGIELAQRLHKKLPRCQVIFVSSFLDYATSVYDVEHVYFILKSQMAQRLGPALRPWTPWEPSAPTCCWSGTAHRTGCRCRRCCMPSGC